MSVAVLQFSPGALAQLRAERNLTFAELGRHIGRDRMAVYAWERGRKEPSLPTIGRLADALGVDFTVLIERAESGE